MSNESGTAYMASPPPTEHMETAESHGTEPEDDLCTYMLNWTPKRTPPKNKLNRVYTSLKERYMEIKEEIREKREEKAELKELRLEALGKKVEPKKTRRERIEEEERRTGMTYENYSIVSRLGEILGISERLERRSERSLRREDREANYHGI